MFLNRRLIMVLAMGALFANATFALPNDSDQSLRIISNSQLLNFKSGQNVYEGNVVITQGSTEVKADRVTTKSNPQHKIEEAIAYGINHPAEYSTQPKTGDVLFKAQAKIIRFYPIKGTIMLEGNVLVIQGENSFHGQLIVYNMKDQTVVAPVSKSGRATIVIEPDKLSHDSITHSTFN